MNTAFFTFHGSLNYFLPHNLRNNTVQHCFDWKASIKDMVEALGPPHPEVELLVVNGISVGWHVIVQPDDTIHAFPEYEAVDVPDKIRLAPPYPGRPRFILDTHLGKLAGYLRMMGFDTLYRNDFEDDVLAQISCDENRILLSRDIGVLKRGIVTHGYFVRNTNPVKRLIEINQRYQLTAHIQPFAYCMKCNGPLRAIAKDRVLNRIPAGTASYYDEYHQCESCNQIFWKGSHYQKMRQLIETVINAD